MGNVRRPAMHMAAVMASSLMADLVKKMVAGMVVMVADDIGGSYGTPHIDE